MRTEVTGPFAPYEVDPFSPRNFAPSRRARRADAAAARSRSRALARAERLLDAGRAREAFAVAAEAGRSAHPPRTLPPAPVRPGDPLVVVTYQGRPHRTILGQPRRVRRGEPMAPVFLDHAHA